MTLIFFLTVSRMDTGQIDQLFSKRKWSIIYMMTLGTNEVVSKIAICPLEVVIAFIVNTGKMVQLLYNVNNS